MPENRWSGIGLLFADPVEGYLLPGAFGELEIPDRSSFQAIRDLCHDPSGL